MPKQINPLFLKDERKQTDDSLGFERGKTDESFGQQRERAEHDTDVSVKKDRLAADVSREERRSKADEKSHSIDSKNLSKERSLEDRAINSERQAVDNALIRERDRKESAFIKLFGAERDATDKNLINERLETDSISLDSERLLSAEQVAHRTTKTALTSREEFVAVVSHDLRNPVGAISSCADMLLEEPEVYGINEEGKHWLRFIRRNAESSLRLIRDILDMERITEGKISLQLKESRMTEIIREVVQDCSHLASSKSILVRAAVFKGKSDSVLCDRDRIAQVLQNILGNALKFTPEGGTVTIGCERVDGNMEVFVQDTGPGIPEDMQTKVFDRFAQLNNKDRRGLGLGLFISKTLIESHLGKIWVAPSAGRGATFRLSIPVNHSP